MILSVSRRTDIPAYYGEWFLNRLKDKYVMVRNPMNYHSVSKIDLSPSFVDCIVFWTKNPEPFFPYLEEIEKSYKFYFQYTLNAYGKEIERNIPNVYQRVQSLKTLSQKYGSEKVIWRYDPVLLSEKYTLQWHVEQFRNLCASLHGFVNTCVFSFVDLYTKISTKLRAIGARVLTNEEMLFIAKEFSTVAQDYNITLKTCTESVNLETFGIEKACCVDGKLISQLLKCNIIATKDKNQRQECGCVESIDIGQYNTCANGCVYCYANFSDTTVESNHRKHDPHSPLLIGNVEEDDKIHERPVKSIKQLQLSIFDL